MGELVLVFDTKYSKEINIDIDDGIEVEIDWGSGTKIRYDEKVKYTYVNDGIHTVRISGKAKRIDVSDNKGLVACKSFGNLGLLSLSKMFFKCPNLIEVPKKLPTSVIDISYLFGFAKSFSQEIGSWDVSRIENMKYCFAGATHFNANIESWNVSNVINMSAMFSLSTFNGNIGSWDVSKVEDMGYMFSHTKFNGNIGSWDVSKVKNMRAMFFSSLFNGNIGRWDVSNVEDTSYMFSHASLFNQDVGGWSLKEEGSLVDTTNMLSNTISLQCSHVPPWYKG